MKLSGILSRREFVGAAATLAAVPAHAARDGLPDFLELPVATMERIDPTVWVEKLAPAIWVTCFSFDTPDLGWVPCNGLIMGSGTGATIVDTGNTWKQGDLLVKAARRLTGEPVRQAIATHFHGDRTGGMAAMAEAGIPVLAHPFTVGLAITYGERVPQPVKGLEKGAVDFGSFELFYPGPGHTRDNITVWHKEARCLFGGCLLRATTDKQIGSRGDADMGNYLSTIDRLAKRYPGRKITVPGHGAIAGDAVEWTRTIAERALSKSS
ncbi:MAG: MBL fold metallo-hydrolase [Sphingomonas sp.]|jgi:metallo-beta-lactamase class B|uniref:MBL fold metallo-hydrolase n=1 Tax=Sphingomonas sp. TaxID=28214 RepID=UPI003566F4DF